MKLHPTSLVLAALLVGSAMFAVCYWTASRACIAFGTQRPDDLAWICHEFKLTDVEMARIRLLHEGYLPKCEAMCVRIDAKNRELAAVLDVATNISTEVERKLGESAALRAECQAQMLRHFQEVARTMPVEQGARYLAEMRHLTLGMQGSLEDVMTHPSHERP